MGTLFKAPGAVIYIIGGLWGLFLCLSIVYHVGGIILTAVALILAPVVLYLAPFYAGFWQGDWFPLILIYGTGVVACGLFWVGAIIDD